MKNKQFKIVLSIFPLLLFIIAYKFLPFNYAVVIGFSLGSLYYVVKYIKHQKLSFIEILAIVGLLNQTFFGLLAKDPKSYFVYPIVENIVYALVLGVSILMNKDIISLIAHDLNESEVVHLKMTTIYRRISFLWCLFMLLKASVKIIGIMYWPFEMVYTINWILGTPISFILMWYSFTYPKKFYRENYSEI